MSAKEFTKLSVFLAVTLNTVIKQPNLGLDEELELSSTCLFVIQHTDIIITTVTNRKIFYYN